MSDFTRRPAKSGGKKENIFLRIVKYLIPWSGDPAREIIRKLVFLAALGCFLYFGGTTLFDLTNELKQQNVDSNEYRDWVSQAVEGDIDLEDPVIQEVIEKEPEILPQYIKLYAENNDVVGWVKIDGTQIDYPVVQADDNDYYLTHTIKHEYSKGGAIFADYRNVFTPTETSANTIMFGHNIMTGEYLTNISNYHTQKNPVNDSTAFYRDHPLVKFDTIYEEADWKIFACVLFNTQEEYGEVFDYISKNSFSDVHDFNNYILDIMDRSVFWTDVDLTYGDKIITMSTCYWPYNTLLQSFDTRCVIFARKVREGESSEVDVSKAIRNPNPKLFQLELDRGVGYSFSGRQWDTSKLLSYDGE